MLSLYISTIDFYLPFWLCFAFVDLRDLLRKGTFTVTLTTIIFFDNFFDNFFSYHNLIIL